MVHTWSLHPAQYLWLRKMRFSGSEDPDARSILGLVSRSVRTNGWWNGSHCHRNWHRCKTTTTTNWRELLFIEKKNVCKHFGNHQNWIFTPAPSSKKYPSSAENEKMTNSIKLVVILIHSTNDIVTSLLLRSASLSVRISPMYCAIKVPRWMRSMHRTPKPFARSLHSNTWNGTFDPFCTTRFLHSNLLQPHTSLHSKMMAGSLYLWSVWLMEKRREL